MVRKRKKKRSSREECQNMYGSFEAKGVTTRASYIGDKLKRKVYLTGTLRYYVLSSFFLSLK